MTGKGLQYAVGSLKRNLTESAEDISRVEEAIQKVLHVTSGEMWVRQPDALQGSKIGRACSAFKQSLADLQVAEEAVEEHFVSMESVSGPTGARVVWVTPLGSARGWLLSLNSTQAVPALRAVVREAEAAVDEAAATASESSAEEEAKSQTAELAVDALLTDLDEGSSAADEASGLVVGVSADELELSASMALEREADAAGTAGSKRERALQALRLALGAEQEATEAALQLAEARAAVAAAAKVEATVRRP